MALPGSKSQTARALVLAALADGPATVRGALRARDTTLMATALTGLGADVDTTSEDWTVQPGPLHATSVDTGLAGTVMRFVPPIAALADGDVVFDGDAYARTRPMGPLLDALRQAGVEVVDDGRGSLPFTVRGRGSVAGGVVDIDSSASSQFVSALLLAAPRWDKGVVVRNVGARPVPSLPHIAMTVAALRAGGVTVTDDSPEVWEVAPGPIRAHDVDIEPDLSNAAPFLAAAVITGGEVTIPGWPTETDQAGDALRDLLAAMGATVFRDDAGVTVRGGSVHGVDVDLHDVGELTPVLAAVAAVADSPSTLRGVAHLRGHETDRISALARELSALGADVVEDAGGLVIRPRALHAGTWHSYADHRMAQAGAVLGLAVPGLTIDDIDCTTKTLADFPGLWAGLVASSRPG